MKITATALALLIITATARATEPGAETHPMKVQDLDVRLFIAGVGVRNGQLSGVHVVWIPESLKSRCAGLSLKAAGDIDHARRYPPAGQKAEPIPPDEIPNFVLDTWITPENAGGVQKPLIAELVKKATIQELMKKTTPEHSEYEVPALAREPELPARVHWELWGNGENFTVTALR